MTIKRRDMWTPKMVYELNRIVAEGKSASLIAKELNSLFNKNLTRHSVIGKLHRIRDSSEKVESKRKPTKRYKRPIYAVDGMAFENPKAKAIEFMQLRDGVCKFPIGEIKDESLRFCGAPADSGTGRPYCSYCIQIAYKPLR